MSPLTRLSSMASPPNGIYAYVSPRGGAESVRTFKCRGGLANDSSSQKRLILKCDRRSSTQKSSHCRSPVLAPVRFAMFVLACPLWVAQEEQLSHFCSFLAACQSRPVQRVNVNASVVNDARDAQGRWIRVRSSFRSRIYGRTEFFS